MSFFPNVKPILSGAVFLGESVAVRLPPFRNSHVLLHGILASSAVFAFAKRFVSSLLSSPHVMKLQERLYVANILQFSAAAKSDCSAHERGRITEFAPCSAETFSHLQFYIITGRRRLAATPE